MNEMVARVARAIVPDAFSPFKWRTPDLAVAVRITGEHRRQQEQARRDAVAAIAAIREPTEAMMLAGARSVLSQLAASRPINDIAREAWRAMIDEALKDA